MPKFKAKMKKGQWESQHRGPLLALKWHDKREIHMLTTLLTDGKSTVVTDKPIVKPTCIIEYNKNMGSLDKTDMMLSSVNCLRKSVQWYKKIAFHIVNLYLLNSHTMYKNVTRKK